MNTTNGQKQLSLFIKSSKINTLLPINLYKNIYVFYSIADGLKNYNKFKE